MGVARPGDFDEPVAAAKLYEKADELVKPVENTLRCVEMFVLLFSSRDANVVGERELDTDHSPCAANAVFDHYMICRSPSRMDRQHGEMFRVMKERSNRTRTRVCFASSY